MPPAPKPLRIDTFMVNDDLDILECRLVELYPIVDYFVAVEADVDHQDHPKPYHLTEAEERFKPYADKLVVVHATGLPTAAEKPDPWAREHAQREFVWAGLDEIGAGADDIVFHGDVDEIPTRLWARNIKPNGSKMYGCQQILYSFAVDWQHPHLWNGTVAGRVGAVQSFGVMRDTRNFVEMVPSGWHLSWLGGEAANRRKLSSFCHSEVRDRIEGGLDNDNVFLRDGIHADLVKMIPVDVDHSWPRWVYQRQCPENWFRPR